MHGVWYFHCNSSLVLWQNYSRVGYTLSCPNADVLLFLLLLLMQKRSLPFDRNGINRKSLPSIVLVLFMCDASYWLSSILCTVYVRTTTCRMPGDADTSHAYKNAVRRILCWARNSHFLSRMGDANKPMTTTIGENMKSTQYQIHSVWTHFSSLWPAQCQQRSSKILSSAMRIVNA